MSANAAITRLPQSARMPGILEHPIDSWLWSVPKIQTLGAQLRMAWTLTDVRISMQRANFCFKFGDKRCLRRIARMRAAKRGRCITTGHTHAFMSKASASRSHFSSSRDHTRPPRLSFALVMVLTMTARRFQRTHPLRGMGNYSVNASKDVGMRVVDLASLVDQNS